ncbi:MAG: urease accessory protein UreD [Acidithiobacillus sp.]
MCWYGNLSLAFDSQHGETVLRRQESSLPLAFRKALYPEGRSVCHGVIIHPPGGVANGDRLSMFIDLLEGAQVLLTTPGASKIYRSTNLASQHLNAQLARGSYLEWLPQETILFNGAQWPQYTRIELAPTARWLSWDIIRFGRTAAAERFTEGYWQSSTEVWRDGQPLWIDHQQLQGGSPLLDSEFGLGGEAVVASLIWIGQAVPREILEDCRWWWHSQGWKGSVGISRLQEGLVARYRGNSSAVARAWFTVIWNHLRQYAVQRSACPPRVWNT